jgi:EpsI family protein
MIKIAVAAAFLALQVYIYNYFAATEVHPSRHGFAEFPLKLGAWSCAGRDTMTDDILANLGVTDYLICDFTRNEPNGQIGVYVGYHESQVRHEGGGSAGGAIHPPKHCLPGSGWDIIANDSVTLDLPGMPAGGAEVNRLVIAKGDARQLVYYWYQERGRVIADDWMKIIWLFWDRARLQRTDGSLVRFTIPMTRDGDAAAEAAFLELAPLVTERLPAFSPGT